jgi:hypothetical protein
MEHHSGVAYVYYDPDVLPEPVKKFLPIQEPKGHGMSLEEYEKWRAQQAGYPSATDKQSQPKEEEANACVAVLSRHICGWDLTL